MMPKLTPPSSALAMVLRQALADIEAGELVVVDSRVRDGATLRVSFELAEPRAEAAADPRRCPTCGERDRVEECGRAAPVEGQPPVLDMLCLRCDSRWQIPEG